MQNQIVKYDKKNNFKKIHAKFHFLKEENESELINTLIFWPQTLPNKIFLKLIQKNNKKQFKETILKKKSTHEINEKSLNFNYFGNYCFPLNESLYIGFFSNALIKNYNAFLLLSPYFSYYFNKNFYIHVQIKFPYFILI